MRQAPPDIDRRARRPASAPREFYQRPHCYSIALPAFAVSNMPTCISLNKARQPAITLFIQADLANGTNVSVGDAGTSLINGIELDPGKAVLFSTADQNILDGGGLQQMSYHEAMQYQRDMAISPGMGLIDPPEVVLDIADFYAATAGLGCRLRIFWTRTTRA